MKKLFVIKIGGNVIDNAAVMQELGKKLGALKNPFILIHGGGKAATRLAGKLEIPQQMVDGRRITDAATLEIAVMVYAGLINKQLVALLQKNGKNALGLCGADAGLVKAEKRKVETVDFGFVGDVVDNGVDAEMLSFLIDKNLAPVFCAITHDTAGQLLNTNADTMAAKIASALSGAYQVHLLYLFEKAGVLKNIEEENSMIPSISVSEIPDLVSQGIIVKGMLPKIKNAAEAAQKGAERVMIGSFEKFEELINGSENAGTRILA